MPVLATRASKAQWPYSHTYVDPGEYGGAVARDTNRRSSAPNILTPPREEQGLSRHPSSPKSSGRHNGNGDRFQAQGAHETVQQQHWSAAPRRSAADDPPPYMTVTDLSHSSTRPRTDSKSVKSTATHETNFSMFTTPGTLGPPAYHYATLDSRQFRLVKILRADMSKISCEIVHQSLDEPERYTAISYAWGDADEKREITLEGDVHDENGHPSRQKVAVQVPVSLHGALGALRQDKDDVFVWVDSLSIDQHNKSERSLQVRLMTEIYGRATRVAVWLEPDANGSAAALQLMQELATVAVTGKDPRRIIADPTKRQAFSALVLLFEREYWKRLWVVQEVTIPRSDAIRVYCGESCLTWAMYQSASKVLRDYADAIEDYFPANKDHSGGRRVTQHQFSFAQVLACQGPGSLQDGSIRTQPLLDTMRTCREKLTTYPLDKVYGIVGLLPGQAKKALQVDYDSTIKKLYTDVVDHIISTTHGVDVLCEIIHFPPHAGTAGLPSWCLDWSHIPTTNALQIKSEFNASGSHVRKPIFLDPPRRKLKIFAIPLDIIEAHGVPIGTLATAQDYLMAFLNWRAVMHRHIKQQSQNHNLHLLEEFSKTLSLDHDSPLRMPSRSWSTTCHHVFASLLRDRLPTLLTDEELIRYADMAGVIRPGQHRRILQETFGAHMRGRSFCVTKNKRMAMGTGFMAVNDIIVVPLGCKTPVTLRREGGRGEYRFVGDVYVHGYMHGKAVEPWENKKAEVRDYTLH